MKGSHGKEILLTTENKVGKLEQIAKAVKDSDISVRGISAWVFGAEAFFRLVVSNCEKARSSLEGLGKVEEKDVIVVDMADEVGQLFVFTSKLKDNNIDLNYIYGTTAEPGASAIIVFSSNDNDKALEVISG